MESSGRNLCSCKNTFIFLKKHFFTENRLVKFLSDFQKPLNFTSRNKNAKISRQFLGFFSLLGIDAHRHAVAYTKFPSLIDPVTAIEAAPQQKG